MPHPSPNGSHSRNGVVRHLILGTAGHIDHGKTSLIRALTGVDTDRLPEERRRGMTIELGFAELVIEDTCFGIVDVPGHERFVRTMVAGATGIDMGLLVVSADDSLMPQTVEHIEILRLLGIPIGACAITRTDAVDPDMVELVADEFRQFVADRALPVPAVCPVSSVTRQGLDDLMTQLLAASRGVPARSMEPPFRMAVDRVFTIQGRGTVVTGSAHRGTVRSGDELEVWPSGGRCRVRDLQAHGQECSQLHRGQRCAMNLSGLDKDTLARGIELATPGYLHGSHVIDVELHCLDVTDKPLKTTATVRLETGTCEVAARIILLDRRRLDPGESCYAQLRAGDPVPSTFGQRFILRSENATRTIGGGVVLRPRGERKRRNADTERDSLDRLRTGNPPDRVEDVLRNAAFTTPPDLTICALAGVELAEVPGLLDQLRREGRWMAIPGTHVMIVPSALTELSQRLCRWLERFHRREPDSPGRHVDAVLGWLDRVTATAVSRPLLDHFVNQGAVKFFGRYVCLAPFAPKLTAADEKLLASLLDTMDSAGFQPPLPELWAKEHRVERKRIGRLLQLAVAMGELASIDGKIYLHTNKEHELRRVVASLIDRHGRVTVAQVRESIESSRKYTVPYMEYLDRIGFTRRDGDERVLNHAEQAEHRAR